MELDAEASDQEEDGVDEREENDDSSWFILNAECMLVNLCEERGYCIWHACYD